MLDSHNNTAASTEPEHLPPVEPVTAKTKVGKDVGQDDIRGIIKCGRRHFTVCPIKLMNMTHKPKFGKVNPERIQSLW